MEVQELIHNKLPDELRNNLHNYRNSLFAVSQLHDLAFLAVGATIAVFRTTELFTSRPLQVTHHIEPVPRRDANVIYHDHNATFTTLDINRLKVCMLGEEEVLIVLDGLGRAFIRYTSWLSDSIDSLIKAEDRFHGEDKFLSIETYASAWGCDISSDMRALAVSCNSWQVMVYSLGDCEEIERHTSDHDNPLLLQAHTGNIPCIAFGEEGRLIASVGVEGECLVWDLLKPSHPLVMYRYMEAAWSCLFIGESAFRYECRVNRHLNDEFNAVRPLTPNDEWYRASSEQIFASAVRGALSDQRSGASRARQLTEEEIRARSRDHLSQVQRVRRSERRGVLFETSTDIACAEISVRTPTGEGVECFDPFVRWVPKVRESSDREVGWTFARDPSKAGHLTREEISDADVRAVDLLLVATESSILLYHATSFWGEWVEETKSPIAMCCAPFGIETQQRSDVAYARLNMVHLVPLMSLLIVASQDGQICLVDLIKTSRRRSETEREEWSYSMTCCRSIDLGGQTIAGMDVLQAGNETHRRAELVVVCHCGTTLTYRITRVANEVSIAEIML